MSIYKKLLDVQSELKAPKGQENTFGKYKYRSCEDILEAVKPILKKYNAALYISDHLEIAEPENYIRAEVTFIDVETGETITNSAYARESRDKKGMDSSQITGATSSYARKYALNGMLCIDDTKDADTDEFKKTTKKDEPKQQDRPQPSDKKITEGLYLEIETWLKGKYPAEISRKKYEKILEDNFKVKSLKDITMAQYEALKNKMAQ